MVFCCLDLPPQASGMLVTMSEPPETGVTSQSASDPRTMPGSGACPDGSQWTAQWPEAEFWRLLAGHLETLTGQAGKFPDASHFREPSELQGPLHLWQELCCLDPGEMPEGSPL